MQLLLMLLLQTVLIKLDKGLQQPQAHLVLVV
jgi:hypothetical protein